MKYVWADGSMFTSKQFDPNVVGEYLVERKIDTAEKFVEDATSMTSPLHMFIDWDNQTAAHEYRLVQARSVIRSLKVVYEKSNGKAYSVKAFTHLRSIGAYAHVVKIRSMVSLREEAIQQALHDMEAFTRRFESYRELAKIGSMAQRQISKLLKKRKRIA
jgi:transcriptional regulator GlxA family with amidase domain